jgi:hypothetical protein
MRALLLAFALVATSSWVRAADDPGSYSNPCVCACEALLDCSCECYAPPILVCDPETGICAPPQDIPVCSPIIYCEGDCPWQGRNVPSGGAG